MQTTLQPIILDGAQGEGGGQILRTALSLSLITGRPFELHNIRAGRKKPGLMRQHLVCVQAARQIGQAMVTGDILHSTTLTFRPHTVQAGHYHFKIGSAGSTLLVLQTVLPALLMQAQPSSVCIEGGTHNPMAPTADFIQVGFLPILQKMGIAADLTIEKTGFFPVGGGKIMLNVQPWLDKPPLILTERGAYRGCELAGGVQNLGHNIVNRELTVLREQLPLPHTVKLLALTGDGEGNALYVKVVFEQHHAVFTALGSKGLTAENVAKKLAEQVMRYLEQTGAVDEYLTDQLLLPMALGQGGELTCDTLSLHTKTQADIIMQFLPVQIVLTDAQAGKPAHLVVKV